MPSVGDIPERARIVLRARSMGRCELCKAPAVNAHHRDPRGMGGTSRKGIHRVCNLLHLCASCHAWIESFRDLAETGGWLIPSGTDPARRPVWLHGVLYWAGWWLLDDHGSLTPVDAEERALPDRPILPEWAA